MVFRAQHDVVANAKKRHKNKNRTPIAILLDLSEHKKDICISRPCLIDHLISSAIYTSKIRAMSPL